MSEISQYALDAETEIENFCKQNKIVIGSYYNVVCYAKDMLFYGFSKQDATKIEAFMKTTHYDFSIYDDYDNTKTLQIIFIK